MHNLRRIAACPDTTAIRTITGNLAYATARLNALLDRLANADAQRNALQRAARAVGATRDQPIPDRTAGGYVASVGLDCSVLIRRWSAEPLSRPVMARSRTLNHRCCD